MGAVLTLLAALTRRVVERRAPPPAAFPPASGLSPPPIGPSPIVFADDSPATVGSDHSTVVRPRVPSTIDRVASPSTGSAFEAPG